MWDAMPWERIERATSWIAGMGAVWAEDVHDVRADITLGTFTRMADGMPVDAALSRAVSEARNNIIRNRVCGMTGRWQASSKWAGGLYNAHVVTIDALEEYTRRVLGPPLYRRA